MPKQNSFFESLKVECTMLSTHSTHLTCRFRLTIRPRLEYMILIDRKFNEEQLLLETFFPKMHIEQDIRKTVISKG